MKTTTIWGAAVGVALLLSSSAAGAQKPVSQSAQVTETFTIEAIDHSARLVTLKDAQGETETIYAGPEVERFNALKVGQKVTFRYWESMVYSIAPAGAKPSTGGGAVVRTPGDKPGGTISQQMTATVTINAIDPKAPSVTVTTDDGRKMSLKVEDPKNLDRVKVGDKVLITYTQALAISVQ